MARRRTLTPMRLRHVRRPSRSRGASTARSTGRCPRDARERRLARAVHERYHIRHPDQSVRTSGRSRRTPSVSSRRSPGSRCRSSSACPRRSDCARSGVSSRCSARRATGRTCSGTARARRQDPGDPACTAPVIHDLEVFDDVAAVVPETVSAANVSSTRPVALRLLLRDVTLELEAGGSRIRRSPARHPEQRDGKVPAPAPRGRLQEGVRERADRPHGIEEALRRKNSSFDRARSGTPSARRSRRRSSAAPTSPNASGIPVATS